MKHIFGPVTSRRYGQSLGVDLSVPKTCSLSCRFCQLGPTPSTTVTRTVTPAIEDVLAELEEWLKKGGRADFITEAGSGEPTLHAHFGDVFQWVRDHTSCRSLLLSNGTLFTEEDVRKDAAKADVVKVSLHAWDQQSFKEIARPHASLQLDQIVEGYRRFRDMYFGRLDVEVFIVPGINDKPEQAERIAALIRTFSPDGISLNTAVRPPADPRITAASPEVIRKLLPIFGDRAHAGGKEPPIAKIPYTVEALIGLVDRHPVSLSALARSFSLSEEEMRERLIRLDQEKKLHFFKQNGSYFGGPIPLE